MAISGGNGNDESLIRIGDLARLTGKTVRAIHLYEELGLLKPATRSSGGFRLYESRAVDRVRWIELLHGMGFSLHEMKEVLEAWWKAELGPDAMSRLRGLFQTKLRETREAVERHKQIERELLEGLAYLETCKVCATLTNPRVGVSAVRRITGWRQSRPCWQASRKGGRSGRGARGCGPGEVGRDRGGRPQAPRAGRVNESSERSMTGMIQFTSIAAQKVKDLLTQRGTPDIGLRLGVRGGGCSGNSYFMEFCDAESPGDEIFETHGIRLYIDLKSAVLLGGTEVDYVEG